MKNNNNGKYIAITFISFTISMIMACLIFTLPQSNNLKIKAIPIPYDEIFVEDDYIDAPEKLGSEYERVEAKLSNRLFVKKNDPIFNGKSNKAIDVEDIDIKTPEDIFKPKDYKKQEVLYQKLSKYDEVRLSNENYFEDSDKLHFDYKQAKYSNIWITTAKIILMVFSILTFVLSIYMLKTNKSNKK